MINSKLENFLSIVVLYGILIGIRFVLPVSDPPTNKNRVAIIILSIFIWLILLRIYLRLRDKRVVKKVDLYLKQNEFDACILYIDKCLQGHKKTSWLKIMKAYALAMAGHIGDFYDFTVQIKDNKRCLAHIQLIQIFNIIFSFLKGEDCTQFSPIDNSSDVYVMKIGNLLQNINYNDDSIIPTALQLYRTPYNLFKSVVALVLAEQYAKIGDTYNMEIYTADAKKYAPSSEVLFYLTKHEGDSQITHG